MMRTDDGRIDHLQCGVRHSASREPFQDHVPDDGKSKVTGRKGISQP
jgi:hypothetical protein